MIGSLTVVKDLIGDLQEMIRVIYACVFLLMLAACSDEDEKLSLAAKKDFDLFCEQFTIMTNTSDFSLLTSEQRAAKLDVMLIEKIEQSGNAYIAWTAIRNGPPPERYSLYKDAAASAGYTDWKCPAAESHGSDVGSSLQ